MGRDDDLDDDTPPELPPEAFSKVPNERGPRELDDSWIQDAEADNQRKAMRHWFLSRFCDPALGTPYDSEVGYIFVNGGPHDPSEELWERFGDIVEEELIDEVADEMVANHGDEWAPIWKEPPDDYDVRFDMLLRGREEPLERLRERLQQLQQVLTLSGDSSSIALAQKLVFGAAIGALESFLWETAQYWIENDDRALRDFVTKLPVFRDEKINLGDLFERQKGLKEHVKGYLQNMIWHRWDRVVPLFEHGLGIRLPSMKQFDPALVKRHDIVHRSGRDKDGSPISVTPKDIEELCSKIETFAVHVDSALASRKPLSISGDS